jgi:5-(carboxyamino)imidazole ribonucleotide synthase
MAAILPPATLGLLGGGQLGRFFVAAAHELGYAVLVLDPDPDCPAARIADGHLCAGWDDPGAIAQIAQRCHAVTTEFENVPATTLRQLAASVPVRPDADAVAICQDRRREKEFLRQHRLPHGPCVSVTSDADIAAAPANLFPGILKTATLGYDGKGQVSVTSREQAAAAFAGLGRRACVLEARLALDCEISVVLVRDAGGDVRCFPPAGNRHRHGILDVSMVPARVSPQLAQQAQQVATTIAAGMNYVGTLAVEFFISGGRLYVNEMAPRPHNSGHYTLDACASSQYEQQVRALCGLPLGEVTTSGPTVMVNLLGDLWTAGEPDWEPLLRVPGLKLHLYGKREARPGRKMGHFTVVGADPTLVLESALRARALLGIVDEETA